MRFALAVVVVARMAAAEVPLPTPPPPPPAVLAHGSPPYRVMPWGVFAGSAALGTAAVVVALVASMMADNLRRSLDPHLTAASAAPLIARLRTAAMLTDFGTGLSIALVVNTAVLAFFTRWTDG